MHRRRSILMIGAASATLALGLAACAPGSGTEPDSGSVDDSSGEITTDIASLGDVTLSVWDQEVRGGQNEQIELLNAAFMEKYDNVTIERNSQAFDDLATTLRLAITDEDAPDVVQANNGRNTMGEFVEAGQLRPLDDYAAEYGWTDRFSPSILQYSTYSDDASVFGDGNLYGLPQVGEVVGVFYSKSKLADLALDVPADWSEFDEALAAAKDAGEIPMQLGNIEQWPALHVFGPLQGDFVDAEAIVGLGLGNAGASWTTPENEEAAAQLQEWVDAGYFNDGVNGTDYDAAWQELADGEGVFLIGGSWLAADLEDASGEDIGFFVPAREDGTKATTGGTGLPFAVTSASESPDAAAAYIDFLTSDEAMQILADTGNLPVNDAAAHAPDAGVQSDVFSEFGEVADSGEVLPYLDYATPTFADTMGQALQDLLDGRATPAEFTQVLEADYSEFTGSE